jgi:ribosomal protein L21
MPFVIQSGNKQYIVSLGQKFVVDRLNFTNEGDVMDFPVMYSFGGDTPRKTIKVKIASHVKGEKIRVVKYRAKSNYHRQYGFRPFQTILEVVGDEAPVAEKKTVKSESTEDKIKTPKVKKEVSKIKE